MLLRLPDPPLALIETGRDPLTKVGGLFDDAVFDDFASNYVFDCGQVGALYLGDPGSGNMATIPDPPPVQGAILGFDADDYEDSDFQIGYDGFTLTPDPVVVPMVTIPDPVT